jgi:hypothetical protein
MTTFVNEQTATATLSTDSTCASDNLGSTINDIDYHRPHPVQSAADIAAFAGNSDTLLLAMIVQELRMLHHKIQWLYEAHTLHVGQTLAVMRDSVMATPPPPQRIDLVVHTETTNSETGSSSSVPGHHRS